MAFYRHETKSIFNFFLVSDDFYEFYLAKMNTNKAEKSKCFRFQCDICTPEDM